MTTREPGEDVASAVIAQLEQGKAVAVRGSFTLDLVEAREKLASYQLVERERLVLLLVEAATLFGAEAIHVEHGGADTRVELVGVELSADEMRGCLDVLFADVRALDETAGARALGRQRLGVAINTALGEPGSEVELRSAAPGRPSLVTSLRPEGATAVESQPPGTGAVASTQLTLRRARARQAQREAHARQRALVLERARFAALPVSVDGESTGLTPITEVLLGHRAIILDGESIGHAGWSIDEARREQASVTFMAHGVELEIVVLDDLSPGFCAFVDGSELARDLSGAKFIRGPAWSAHVEAVRLTHDSMSEVPRLSPVRRESRDWRTSASCFVLAAVFFAPIPLISGFLAIALAALMGLGLLGLGLSMLDRALRISSLLKHGQLALATITERDVSHGDDDMELTLKMRVELPGGGEREATFSTRTNLGPELLRLHRTYVRIPHALPAEDPIPAALESL